MKVSIVEYISPVTLRRSLIFSARDMQHIKRSRSLFVLPSTIGRYQAKSSAAAPVLFQQDDLFIHTYPGSRVLELSNPDAGNYISKSLATMLDTKVSSLKNNGIVAALFFTSRSPDLFSRGLDRSESHDTASLSTINKLAANISSLKKPCIAVYGGAVGGTGYGVFAGSKYRLGTTSTSFSIQELGFGKLPLGGTAFHLARGCSEGVAVARYLAVTRRSIRAHEMFSLGLLTHIVEEEPHVSLADALAHTIPTLGGDSKERGNREKENDDDRADVMRGLNMPVVEVDAIKELLDTMHIESDIDLASDETWDKFLLVPPSRSPLENEASISSEGE
jgi:enoyl-CoA hydratase/carnithine racemase